MVTQVLRQWRILWILPRAPPRIDVRAIQRRLVEHGFQVTRRTIQRDLAVLARAFPIVADDREKPFGWRWADGAELVCPMPILGIASGAAPEIELRLSVAHAVVRGVLEGLRGREGDACAIETARGIGGRTHVHARVADTCALRRFLLGFGGDVEVIGPASMRADFTRDAASLAARYDRRATMDG